MNARREGQKRETNGAFVSEGGAAEIERLRGFLLEIKRLASDPWASEAVALRACLLAAYEALGLPGPEPSPLRDTARAVIADMQKEMEGS